MDIKKKRLIFFPIIALLLIIVIAANVAAGMFKTNLDFILVGNGVDFSGEETQQALQQSDELVRTLAEDSIVLLKNQNDDDGAPALPLEEDELKVNLFGFSAYDPSNAAAFDGFLMKGIGSGSSTINEEKAVTLQDALTANGIQYNTTLESIYDAFDVGRYFNSNNDHNAYWLNEPTITEAQYQQAQGYSDVAVVVFSRLGGESIGEQPQQQTQGSVNRNKTYLEITDAEQALLDNVTDRFGKVIVILNTSNAMHCGFLDDAGVDAAMYVGLTGQSGAIAIGEILKGKTLDGEELSPSGKLSDLYSYNPSNDPAFANTGDYIADGTNSVQYSENLYFGYRWYETADAEGYFEDKNTSYEEQVQYPFGFGLSYTTFDWDLLSVSVDDSAILPSAGGEITAANKNDTITVKVLVTNTGNFTGKDVVELYYTPEYIPGEVEKSEVNLLDFDKTSSLAPGASEEITLTFTAYDMASFDAENANGNQYSTYELDKGTYTISLRTDSHTLKSNTDGQMENNTIDFELASDVIFEEDPVTQTEIEARFTGSEAYGGVPIDGSGHGASQAYLSREDFAGTFPSTRAPLPSNASGANSTAANLYETAYDTTTMPTQGVDNGADSLMLTYLDENNNTQYDYDLFATLAEDYDAPEWDTLLNQISVSELINLVHFSGFFNQEIDSVGKPELADFDGPAGFNTNTLSGSWSGTGEWTAYPCECLLGCSWNKDLMLQMGLSMGVEANLTKISGWYAPGINLHRTNYTSRNYEYYSEDPILSGNLAANVIHGAKINGLYCYMKHFVVSESGPNGRDWNTWLTEQTLRELYLKPFEIAVKEGGANAVMSSFNNLGSIWTGANYALLTEILRDEWGFRGSVITDWSTGGNPGAMNPRQGIRAGNDIWLNPMTWITGGLQSNNATDVACARRAAHNVIYTLVDTIHYNQTFDREQLDSIFSVTVGVAQRETPFSWWIAVLVVFDVLAVGGLGVWVFFLVKPRKENVAEGVTE